MFATPGRRITAQGQLAANTVGTEQLIDDDITATDIAANAVADSEIAAHTTTKITVPTTQLSGTIATAQIADNAVSLAKQAHGTQGGIPFFGSGGAPSELAVGNSGQFLKTQGAAADPVWDDVPNDWEQLGETTLGSAATSVSVASFAARKDLRVIVHVPGMSGAGTALVTFNSDGGSVYGLRSYPDNATPATVSAGSSIDISGLSNTTQRAMYLDMIIQNHATDVVKCGHYHWLKLDSTPANAPIIMTHGVFSYDNTSTQITTIKFELTANNLNAGTRMTVYGKKD